MEGGVCSGNEKGGGRELSYVEGVQLEGGGCSGNEIGGGRELSYVESVPSASVKACIAKEKEEGQEETYKCPGSKQQIPTGSQIHRSVNEKNVEEEENRVGLPMVCVCVCVCVCVGLLMCTPTVSHGMCGVWGEPYR